MHMLPKEHGAYGQLAVPLLTAWLVSGVTLASFLWGGAVMAAFLAHEPVLVLLGARGARASREHGGRARRWLAASALVTLCAGAGALWLMPAETRWVVGVPCVPAASLAVCVALGREKDSVGEVSASTALSLAAVPACAGSGLPMALAAVVGFTYAVFFAASTLAVRVVVLGVRAGGHPTAVARTRMALASLIVGVVVGASWASSRGMLPAFTLIALGPGVIVAASIAAWPPEASRLRTVGWTLVGTSLATMLVLVFALRAV